MQQQSPHGDRRDNKVAVHPQRRRLSLGAGADYPREGSTERRPSKLALLRQQTSSALQGVKRPFTDLLHLSAHRREGAPAKEQSSTACDGRVPVASDEAPLSREQTPRRELKSSAEESPPSAAAWEVSMFEESLEAFSPTTQRNAKASLGVELLLEENARFLRLADTNLSLLARYLSSQADLTDPLEPWCVDSLLSVVTSALLGDQQSDKN